MHYLNIQMRVALLLGSLLAFAFVIGFIRKNRVKIEDTIFWVLLSIALLIFSIFPQIVYFGRKLLSIESPANFVFLLLIAVLLANSFYQTMKISSLEIKLKEMAQRVALDSSKAPGESEKPGEADE